MRGVNKVILVGTLGADPDMGTLPSGGQVANISLATSEEWKDKNNGQKQERTEWHRVVAFNKLADIFGMYLRQGINVYIEGSLRTRKWQDKAGNDRYTTEIIASQMQILTPKSQQGKTQGGQPTQQNQQQQQQGGGDFDDDLPF